MTTVSHRTFYCRVCRKFTRLALPTEQRSCGHCGESLLSLFREEDFVNTNDPEVIGNWLRVMKTRNFGLGERAHVKTAVSCSNGCVESYG